MQHKCQSYLQMPPSANKKKYLFCTVCCLLHSTPRDSQDHLPILTFALNRAHVSSTASVWSTGRVWCPLSGIRASCPFSCHGPPCFMSSFATRRLITAEVLPVRNQPSEAAQGTGLWHVSFQMGRWKCSSQYPAHLHPPCYLHPRRSCDGNNTVMCAYQGETVNSAFQNLKHIGWVGAAEGPVSCIQSHQKSKWNRWRNGCWGGISLGEGP